MVAWLASAAFVGAAWLLALGLGRRGDPRISALLPTAPVGPDRGGLLAAVGRRVPLGPVRAAVERRVPASGGRADRVLGAKVAGAALGLILGASAWPLGLGASAAAVALAAGGFVLPDFSMARRGRRIRAQTAAALPDLLDVVAVGATAGLTPRLALERAGSAVAGPLRSELERARSEVAMGASWWSALRDAAARSGLTELRRVAVTLERSSRLGAPVAEPLRQLARDVRAEHRARAEERARRAPVAMLFPLVFCILPAFVVAAVVPAVLVATRGIT